MSVSRFPKPPVTSSLAVKTSHLTTFPLDVRCILWLRIYAVGQQS